MSLKDAFVNVAQSAATSMARSAVNSVVGGIAAGLKGNNPQDLLSNLGAPSSRVSPILSYPDDVAVDPMQGHYILFGIRTNEAGTIASPRKPVKNVTGGRGGDPRQFVEDLTKEKLQTLQKQSIQESNSKNSTLTMKRRSSTKLVQSIALYMPPQVSVSYEAKYADQEIGVMAEAGAEALKNLMAANFSGAAKNVGDGVVQGAKNLGLKALDEVAPGAKAIVALERGKIITPRMELMFEGLGRRNFEFTFLMIPKSAAEAQKIRQIVNLFKKHMSSDIGTENFGGSKNVRELNIPDVFDIKYMYREKENTFLNKIGTSYLTGMDVSYGGDRYTAYEPDATGSPPPQRTSITLKFSEIEIMYRNRIEEGF